MRVFVFVFVFVFVSLSVSAIKRIRNLNQDCVNAYMDVNVVCMIKSCMIRLKIFIFAPTILDVQIDRGRWYAR